MLRLDSSVEPESNMLESERDNPLFIPLACSSKASWRNQRFIVVSEESMASKLKGYATQAEPLRLYAQHNASNCDASNSILFCPMGC